MPVTPSFPSDGDRGPLRRREPAPLCGEAGGKRGGASPPGLHAAPTETFLHGHGFRC